MKSQKQIKDKIYRERKFFLAMLEKARERKAGSRESNSYYDAAARQEKMIEALRWVLK